MAFTTELWQANLIALVSAFVAIKLLRPVAVYFGLVDVPSGRKQHEGHIPLICLLYTSPSPRDGLLSRMPSSA